MAAWRSSPFAGAEIDFSWIADLPKRFSEGDKWRVQKDLAREFEGGLPKNADKTINWTAAWDMVARHDPELAFKSAASRDTLSPYQLFSMANSQAAADRAETAANRDKYKIVQMPDEHGVLQTFQQDRDTNEIKPIEAPGVGKRHRPMSVNDVTKLSEEGGKAAQAAGFVQTFEDRYGGWGGGVRGVSDLKMAVGRSGWAQDKDQVDAAQWWQGYDRYKNVVRHGLFGSALTPTEQQQWEKADVNPAMDPETIRNNLALQKRLVDAGIKRKARALETQGFNPQTVNEAYGLPGVAPEQPPPDAAPAPITPPAPIARSVPTMNVSPDGTMTPTQAGAASLPINEQTAPPVPGATQMNVGPGADPHGPYIPRRIQKGSPEELQIFQWARDAMAKGAPRDAVMQRLRELGVGP